MTNKEIALAIIAKVQKTKCKIPLRFEAEYYWRDLKIDEVGFELMGFFFSRDFLENFFGENWKRNAKEMVVNSQPLKYLELFIS